MDSKKRVTTILSFIVVKPDNECETVGEQLMLSLFGEYCPNNSLRGYSLYHLITHPENYAIESIIQKGETYTLTPPVAAASLHIKN